MEARCFYFTVHSASDLQDVREFGRMKVYAKVSMAGKTKCTEVDLVNETNPEWNTTLCFVIPEKDIIQGSISAKIELFCKRTLSHDKYVGELLLSLAPRYKGECTFPVRRNDNSNKSKSFGTLTFSHVLGDKLIVADSSSSTKDNKHTIEIIQIGVGIMNAVATAFT
ncbi:hypothetical protein A4A49_14038 [Nicotiana attenuata]|uniref:C2 domain-containing protein n=1 Tax=Nicotiana attenuata TaxID=49451 RepID=A0A1J6IFU4_NICAT|nr:hypothetical protein A4A49_14038 [Nicotiana attenuata]